MNRRKKRFYHLMIALLTLVLCVGMLPCTGMAAEGASEEKEVDQNVVEQIKAGSSISTATPISMNTTYRGSITDYNNQDFYKFTLGTSGRVRLTSSAGIEVLDYELYNAAGEKIWSAREWWNDNTNLITLNEPIDLTAGTYYLGVIKYSGTGNYSFKLSFASAGESFGEKQGGSNNSLATASVVGLNKTYKGQIAQNDERDFYKFTLGTSGRVRLTSSAGIKRLDYELYNAAGEKIWSVREWWNDNTNLITLNEPVDLTAGTYYLGVIRYYTGNYSFKLAFASAGESFREKQGGSNNSLAAASVIGLNKTYKGQMALNDEKDFYCFKLSKSGKYRFTASSDIYYMTYTLYGVRGNELWSSSPYRNDNTGKSAVNELQTMKAGTYYLWVTITSPYCTGTYSFRIGDYLKTPAISKTANTSSGIRVAWKKTANAAGYYVYRKAGSGQWKKVKTTTSTAWTDSSAKTNGGRYSYKIYAYKGSTVSGAAAKTTYRLSTPKVSKAQSVKGKKISVKWSRNVKASGYQVRYVTGSNSKIKTFAGRKTVKGTISGLKKGRTYKVYVRSYKKAGNTRYYSAWSAVKKTKARR